MLDNSRLLGFSEMQGEDNGEWRVFSAGAVRAMPDYNSGDIAGNGRRSVKRRIRNFLEGLMAAWAMEARGYGHPTGGGFAQDAKSMRGDFAAVGCDLGKALRKHGQAADSR